MAWHPQGSRPTTLGQVEGIENQEVIGAVQAVVAHPASPDVLYLAAANGGIWRTANATAARPHWEPLTDLEKSLSFGALESRSHRRRSSDIGRRHRPLQQHGSKGGALVGLLRTTNGGTTWTTLTDAALRMLHVTGVAARGSTIVLSSNNAGIFRSTNTGAGWSRLSGAAGTGLPTGACFDLAGDPTNPARLFAPVGGQGLFRSTDTGATWTRVSDATIDALLLGANNVRISVGIAANVYVVIASGRVTGLFRSGNGGANWSALDLPRTVEGGGKIFDLHPGGQAGIHLSIAADRDNPNLVYVGGDRQPGFDEGIPPNPAIRWPNSLGAGTYSGRLFRIDASKPSGSQSTALTHRNTASGSAPHADSRDMAITVDGMLLETDDGGVYRRTRPQADNGDWFSLNGDLQITEFHSVAWDANCRTVIGGAQDTGTPQQLVNGATRWSSVSSADGGVVAVDATSTPGLSTRYSSFQKLQTFRRQVFDSTGGFQSETTIGLRVVGGLPKLEPQFYTPIALNSVAPRRLVIGADNSVYESDDQGDTITAISPIRINDAGAIAYGAAGNPDILYVGAGTRVFVRTAAHPAPLTASAAYPGTGFVVGIAVVPDDPQAAFAADELRVFRTTNAGAQWTDITSNLPTLGVGVVRSIAYCSGLDGGSVVAGTNNGVFAAAGPAFATWTKLGTGLPTVPVPRLQFSDTDRVLLAGTMGRGAWTLTLPSPAVG